MAVLGTVSGRRWSGWWRSRLFGATVALVALALAAVYPVLIELSGTLVAENLLLVFLSSRRLGRRCGRAAPRHPSLDRRDRGPDRAGHAHPRERDR